MREAIYGSSGPARMPRNLPDPGRSRDFEELVWENGTLLMRGRSNRNRDNVISSSAYDHFSKNDLAGCEEENEDREEKAARFGANNHVFLFTAVSTSRPSDKVPQPFQTPAKSNSRSTSGEMNKANFSHFLGLHSLFNTSKDQESGSSRSRISSTKVEMDNTLKEKPSREDENRKDSQKLSVLVEAETNSDAEKAGPSRFVPGRGDFLVPDEHSQAAIGSNFIEDHQSTSFDDDHQVPGPDSSLELEASSSPLSTPKQRRLDVSESTYLDEDEDEETEDHTRRSLNNRGGGAGTKRSRPAIDHNLPEKRRKYRINKRIRALQELLPTCDKVDKASVLDEAIQYVKTLQLQLQLQMMSTGTRLLASPMAMLPAGIHQMSMPFLNQFSPVSPVMGMGPCFAQGLAHQFPVPGASPATLPGGFQPMSSTPYTTVLGGYPALRPLVNQVDISRTAATVIEQPAPAPISGSNDSNQSKGL